MNIINNNKFHNIHKTIQSTQSTHFDGYKFKRREEKK